MDDLHISFNACLPQIASFDDWTSGIGLLEIFVFAVSALSCCVSFALTLTQLYHLQQRLVIAHLPLISSLNLLPMLLPSANRLVQLFIFMLGSHVISDVLRYEVVTYWLKSRKASLGCISVRTLHISSVPIRVLTFLACQTGVVRAASLIAQITMIQECFESPMILLIVNLPSTLLGMIALNLLRKALVSSAIAICQVAMFIFTMQYSCFELLSAAHQLHHPTRYSFEYAMFLYRALTIFELLTILLVTFLLRKKKSTTIIHPEVRLRS
uniref:G protein-coupled receptor n=2 Tax=Parascaris univalens TaxID=6257 RepID=A0A915AUM9_PARUN